MATRTKGVIVQSFLNLLENEQFDKITVTDLVDDCQISRQTFYYHFDDIDKMLEWASDEETKMICNKIQESASWYDTVFELINMLKKYELFIKKSMESTKFVFICNLLYKIFYEFIAFYLSNKTAAKETFGKNIESIIECTAGSIVGLVVLAMQNENPDYVSLAQKINIVTINFSTIK